MNMTLARSCFLLWLVGFAGMWMTKGAHGLGDLPFEVCTLLWAVGGLSLCFVVGLDALLGTRSGVVSSTRDRG